MSAEKTVSVSFRVSPRFKRLLVLAAEKEHRSQTNFLEMLLYRYCEQKEIVGESADSPSADVTNLERV